MGNIVLEERSDMRGSYLVAVGCEEGGYKEEMLKNSRIPGLLGVTGQDFNGKHELWYETTSRQPLKLRFSQKAPGVEEVTELMRQIGTLAQRLEDYLLEAEEIVPKLSYIFEGEEGEFLFLYVPGYNKENSGGICRLLEEMMEYVDYEDHRSVSFLYLLHARSRQQTCGIFSLHRLCAEISEAAQVEEERRRKDDLFEEFEGMEDAADQKNKVSWRSRAAGRWENNKKAQERQNLGDRETDKGTAGVAERSAFLEKGKLAKSLHGLLRKMKDCLKMSVRQDDEFDEMPEKYKALEEECTDTVLLAQEEISETVLLTGDSDTVFLQPQELYILKPEENGRESILLRNFPFCIGKEETSSGYVIKEPVISRHHAQILREGFRYFLVDTKSLNGTYLNGKRLAADEKRELKDGDRIDFADICFIFTCCKTPNGI